MKTKTFIIALVLAITTISLEINAQENLRQTSHINKMPAYPGGKEALLHDITSLLQHPKEVDQNGDTGKVHVMFTIDKAGHITNARIYEGDDELLNAEALAAINKLDKTWVPGQQDGEWVNMSVSTLFAFKADGKIDVTPPPQPASLPSLKEDIKVSKTVPREKTVEVAPVVISAAAEEEEEEILIPVYYNIKDMPEFPGGETALRKYIANQVEYPVNAQESGIKGKVNVTFVVGRTGKVYDS